MNDTLTNVILLFATILGIGLLVTFSIFNCMDMGLTPVMVYGAVTAGC